MRVYDNGIDAHRKGLANECGIVRVASRLRSGDRECRQGFISAVPLAAEDILAMLAVARASGHRSGAALRRVELPTRMAHSFGKNFHSRRGERRRRNRRIEAFLRARKRRTPRGGLKARQIQ